jgi:hypothetical protein
VVSFAMSISITCLKGQMVRDARRCRAPHHEGLVDLILRSVAKRCVSKDGNQGILYHTPARHA